MASTAVGSSINHGTVTVTATATQIVPGRTSRKSLLIQAIAPATIGGSGVLTTTGISLAATESVKFDDYNGPLYGVAGTTADVRFLEVF